MFIKIAPTYEAEILLNLDISFLRQDLSQDLQCNDQLIFYQFLKGVYFIVLHYVYRHPNKINEK